MADPRSLAVIGGGPAGAACALAAAAAGLEVWLFEAQRAPWDTVCGEGVMPSGLSVLERLGLGSFAASGRLIPGVRYVPPRGPRVSLDLPRPGAAFLRPALHSALHTALESAPRLYLRHTRVRVARAAEGFLLVETDGTRHSTRTVVVADGRQGKSADTLGFSRRRRGRGQRLGVRARFREAAPLDRVQIHLGRGCELYLTPLPGGLVNAAALYAAPPAGIPPEPSALFTEALRRHSEAASHLGALHTPAAVRSLSRPAPRTPAMDGVFLAGDAAGSVDPVLGCGLAIALAGGLHAADGALALAAGVAPRLVAAGYCQALRREIRSRRRLARLLLFLEDRDWLPDLAAALFHRLPVLGRPLAGIAAGHHA